MISGFAIEGSASSGNRRPPRTFPGIMDTGTSPKLLSFVDRALIVFAFAGLAVLVWRVSDVFMLVFGGILVAAVLHAAADFLCRHTAIDRHWALLATVVIILLLVGFIGWLVGQLVAAQLGQLWQALPTATSKARQWLEGSPLGQVISQAAASLGHTQQSLAGIAGAATSTLGALIDLVVILFLGLYMAADPELYQRGLLRLVPRRGRAAVDEALKAAGQALRRWLMGQLVAMLLVGLTTGVGLALLGVPLAISLGLVAGVLEFIPYIGPIIAAIPAILIGFSEGPQQALLVAVLYLVVHQLEGNVIMPIVQRWAVSLPPALGILAVVVFGLLFGVLGVLFATPLMVVAMMVVQKLYVEEALDEPKSPP
jgi:predicted PurR-regulated permease PerM